MTYVQDQAPSEHWLTAQRLRAYGLIFLGVFGLLTAVWFFQSEGLLDREGKPLGADFIVFWGASHLALTGEPEGAYDAVRLFEASRVAVPAHHENSYIWAYPPTYLLLVLPLAAVPYMAALVLWSATWLAAFLTVLRRLAPSRLTPLLALAFPATYVNLIHGQNGFLSAALLGGAILLLDRRPLLAGVLIGLLSFKPHLGVLLPLALMCSGRWRTFLAATATTLAFAAVSVAAFGLAPWAAFLDSTGLTRAALEQGLLPWDKMMSAFAALSLLGVPASLSLAVQAVIALGVAVITAVVWRRGVSLPRAAAVLVAGSLLVSPYLYGYDLVLLAIPIALLAWDGHETGWLSGEREVLVLTAVMPLFAGPLAVFAGLPLGFPILLLLFWLAARRALWRQEGLPPDLSRTANDHP